MNITKIEGLKHFRKLSRNRYEFTFNFINENEYGDVGRTPSILTTIISNKHGVLDINNITLYTFSNKGHAIECFPTRELVYHIQSLIVKEITYNRLANITCKGNTYDLLYYALGEELIGKTEFLNTLHGHMEAESKEALSNLINNTEKDFYVLKNNNLYTLIFIKDGLIVINTREFNIDEILKFLISYSKR